MLDEIQVIRADDQDLLARRRRVVVQPDRIVHGQCEGRAEPAFLGADVQRRRAQLRQVAHGVEAGAVDQRVEGHDGLNAGVALGQNDRDVSAHRMARGADTGHVAPAVQQRSGQRVLRGAPGEDRVALLEMQVEEVEPEVPDAQTGEMSDHDDEAVFGELRGHAVVRGADLVPARGEEDHGPTAFRRVGLGVDYGEVERVTPVVLDVDEFQHGRVRPRQGQPVRRLNRATRGETE